MSRKSMTMSFLEVCFVCLVVCAVGLAMSGLLSASSCTQETAVRKWGFESTIVLPPGRKLAGVTWKGNDLWTVTKPAKPGESADEVWYLDEHSSWGVFGGRLILRETAK